MIEFFTITSFSLLIGYVLGRRKTTNVIEVYSSIFEASAPMQETTVLRLRFEKLRSIKFSVFTGIAFSVTSSLLAVAVVVVLAKIVTFAASITLFGPPVIVGIWMTVNCVWLRRLEHVR